MFKTCPSCGDEFVEHVASCPDCRVPLRAAGEAPPEMTLEPAPPATAVQERALESAVLLRRGDTTELRQLAEALTAAGIPCAVDTDPPGENIRSPRQLTRAAASGQEARLAVYVDARDAREASAVMTAWFAQTIPGAEGAVEAFAEGGCPGCNEPLAENAVACASCGLEFPPLEVSCPQCGRPVAVEAERCAGCGYHP
jgi:predicted amidophosphoribosyltransferase